MLVFGVKVTLRERRLWPGKKLGGLGQQRDLMLHTAVKETVDIAREGELRCRENYKVCNTTHDGAAGDW